MATARPGWSRRAQYGLFFSFLAVIAGIVVGLILLGLSLVAPKTFESVRGAALDVTGPVAGALHEVTATTEGVFTGAGNYWDAARQNSDLKRERNFMLQRMVEAKAILLENQQLKATLQLREHERSTVAVGRIVGSSFNSPRRFAILSVGRQRRSASRNARAFAGRAGRQDHRCRGPRVARHARFGSCEHRPRTAAARRDPGHYARPWRWYARRPPARGRPQSVQARRHHHHIRHGRAVPAACADRAGREARR